MKGISFLNDETNKKRFVQIDLDLFRAEADAIEDLFDVLVVEARKSEESIAWEKVKKKLKLNGK